MSMRVKGEMAYAGGVGLVIKLFQVRAGHEIGSYHNKEDEVMAGWSWFCSSREGLITCLQSVIDELETLVTDEDED